MFTYLVRYSDDDDDDEISEKNDDDDDDDEKIRQKLRRQKLHYRMHDWVPVKSERHNNII